MRSTSTLMGLRWLVVAGLAAGGVLPALADTHGVSPTDFQYDPVEAWAGRVLLWGVVLALLVVAGVLVSALRDRLVGAVGRVVLVAGAVLLPSICVGMGMLLALSRAGSVEFCGSCHQAIGPYVADMLDPDLPGLAALHFQYRYIPSNQCYECHTSYGLFGSIEAKAHGVREVLRYYTGSYQVPLVMWRPYPNADCLKCHAGSRGWRDEAAHAEDGLDRMLLEDRVSCMDCHSGGHGVVRSPREARG